MLEFSIHPNVYATGARTSLRGMLEQTWVREPSLGEGTFYLVSGFGNYNGGVRFYPTFEDHVEAGGRIAAFLGGSTSQRITSRQLVEELLECGAEVHIVNRKRMLHAKTYGFHSSEGDQLVVTSGNFTGPGMSQNVEVALRVGFGETAAMAFSWADVENELTDQGWQIFRPTLENEGDPRWELLYDERERPPGLRIDESDELTLLLTLGHSDTARINAKKGTDAAKGSQYFWLSKDCYDFFPPLSIPNTRGYKRTYSALITLRYLDIGEEREERVTYEAENNQDFRLGTGGLRYTEEAKKGDLAAITRIGEDEYELRIFDEGSQAYDRLSPYAITFIGHKGKRTGYIENEDFFDLLD
jgi:hypothetical protein